MYFYLGLSHAKSKKKKKKKKRIHKHKHNLCKYRYHLKTLNHFRKKYIKSYFTQMWKERWKPRQKWKVNTATKASCLVKACQNWSDQIVRTAILKRSKKAVLKFLGKHTWRRPLLSRCTACSLERCSRKTSSKMFSCDLFEIIYNFYTTRGTTAVSCLLSYHVFYALILRQSN